MPQDQGLPPDRSPEAVVLCAREDVRDVIAYWLTSLPACATVVADGYQANQLLRKNNCRLLITDRILPPWPGLDTFLELRSANPSLRIAFVDNGNLDNRTLARVTGATKLLSWPLTRKDVIAAFNEAAVR